VQTVNEISSLTGQDSPVSECDTSMLEQLPQAVPFENISQNEKPLSVVFFSHSAYLNGAERSLLGLVEDLVGHRGAICTVILPQHGPLERPLRDVGASVAIMPFNWWGSSDGATQEVLANALTADIPAFFCDIVPFVKKLHPDLIVTQTIVIPWGAAAAAALGKPHIWSVCEYGELDHGLHFVEPFDKIVADIETSSDFVFVNSHDVKKTLFPNLPSERCEVLYRHIEIGSAGEAASAGDSPDHGRRLVGLFGTLARSKGQADAIEAVACLKVRGMLVELVLAGDGDVEYVAELKQRAHDLGIGECVRFTGPLDDPYPAMRACDILLVCSRREAFGRTAVEAMLMAKPLIYTASGGVSEFVEDGKTGLSYPPGEFGILADRIETLFRDSAFAARLGQAGEIFARATFTRENYGGKFHKKALKLRGAFSQRSNFPKALLPAIQRAAAIQSKDIDALETDLAVAQSRIGVLSANAVSAEERLAATLADRARLESLLADSVADVTEAETRIAGHVVLIDEQNARLIEAQGRIAVFERLAVERDKELDSNAKLIAAMKSSLSWRLTSPFRGLRASRRRVKLSAALRHPMNSHKRRTYRLVHTPHLTMAELSYPGRRSRLAANLRAIIRHPFSRQRRRDLRQQFHGFALDHPVSQAFASAPLRPRPYFLKANRPKSIGNMPNWLFYRLLKGLAEQSWLFSERRAYKFRRSANKRAAILNGRSANLVLQEVAHNEFIASQEITIPCAAASGETTQAEPHRSPIDRHPIGFRAEMLINLRPLDEVLTDWTYRGPKRQPVSRSDVLNALQTALSRSNGTGVLALSHDNYRKFVGGVQLCLLVEEAAFLKGEITYIHLCPAQPLPILAAQGTQSTFYCEVTIDGVWLGHVSSADLFAGLASEARKGRRFCMTIHSMLGHSPEITAELYRACDASEAFFWLHDYLSLCPDYTLMRNSVSPCSAPSVGSTGCRICHVGEQRRGHLERLKFLFSEIPFTVVAPSDFTLSLWRGATDLPSRKALVHEHCEIRQIVEPVELPLSLPNNRAAPLNVAYLGAPFLHKGWALFADIARDLHGTPDFKFHHLGKSKPQDYPPDLAFTPVTISSEDWNAMSAAVRLKKIDIAVLCSLWPETYNFTAVEALTGGALIVTLESSGNIAAIVRAHDCGVVFKHETDLRRAFADGSLAREMRDRLQGRRPRYHVTRRNMTADLFSVEGHLSHDH